MTGNISLRGNPHLHHPCWMLGLGLVVAALGRSLRLIFPGVFLKPLLRVHWQSKKKKCQGSIGCVRRGMKTRQKVSFCLHIKLLCTHSWDVLGLAISRKMAKEFAREQREIGNRNSPGMSQLPCKEKEKGWDLSICREDTWAKVYLSFTKAWRWKQSWCSNPALLKPRDDP